MAKKKSPDSSLQSPEVKTETVENILLTEIMPSPLNRHIKDDSVESLALSLKETGLQQPIVIRPATGTGYEIVCGERRWRAARLAGWNTIPAIVRELSDGKAHAARLVENMQREDMPPLVEAEGVKYMLDECSGDVAEVAAQLGVSETWVRVRSNLCNLSTSWREELIDPNTPYERLRDHVTWQEQLAKLPREAQDALAKNKALKYCNSLESLKRVLGEQMRKLSEKPWSDEAEKILGKRYCQCAKCAKRTDRAADLFADLLPADDAEARCLDAECWERKIMDWLRIEFDALRKEHADAVAVIEYGAPSDYLDFLGFGSKIVRAWDCQEPEDADAVKLEENERLVWALIATGDRKGTRTRVIVSDEEEESEEGGLSDAEREERARVDNERQQAIELEQKRVTAFCDRVSELNPALLPGVKNEHDAAVAVVRLLAIIYDHTMTAEVALNTPTEKLTCGLWEMVRDRLQDIANEEIYDPTGRLEKLALMAGIELPE